MGVIEPHHATNLGYMSHQFDLKLVEFERLSGEAAVGRRLRSFVDARSDLFSECVEPRLCHNDLHEGNVMVDRRGGRVRLSGIVDVENALAGDPMLDIAKTIQYSTRVSATEFPEQVWQAFFDGYGPLPPRGNERIQLYRLYHVLELWNWCAQSQRPPSVLAELHDDLMRLSGVASDTG